MPLYLEPGDEMRDIQNVPSAQPRMKRLARGLGVLQDVQHRFDTNSETARSISARISTLMDRLHEYVLEHHELLPPHCTVDWFHPGPLVTPDDETLLQALKERSETAAVDDRGIVTLQPDSGPPIDAKRLLIDDALYTW